MGNDFAADYVDVAERIRLFRTKHPEGSLQSADRAHPYFIETIGDQTFVIYVAAAYRTPDDPCPGIGIAWEQVPGRTPFTRGSEIQNAETSAWGRAIVAVLAADTKHVASADEIRNRQAEEALPVETPADRPALKALLDKTRAAVKFADIQAWVDDQGFGWPWTIAQCNAIQSHADEVVGDAA